MAVSAADWGPRGVGVSTTSRVRPEQVGGHDAGGAGADVDAQCQEGFVVDLDGHPRPSDRSRHRQVGALAEHSRVEQRGDLTVHRGDAELGDLGDDVARNRATQPCGTEHRRGGRLRDAQRRRDDVVQKGLRVPPAPGGGRGRAFCRRGARTLGEGGGGGSERLVRHVIVLREVGQGVGASPGDSAGRISPGSVRRGRVRNNNTHAARQRELPDYPGTRGQLSTASGARATPRAGRLVLRA